MELGLRLRLKWLLAFRWAFLIVMGVTALLLQTFYDDPMIPSFQWILKGGLAFSLLATLTFWPLKNSKILKVHAWLQIVWDIAFTSVLVWMTGGLMSAFVLLSALQIISAGAVLYSAGSIAASLLTNISLFTIFFIEEGAQLFSDSRLLSRSLFTLSALLLLGGYFAYLTRNRQRLANSLEHLSAIHSAIIEHIPSGILYADSQGMIQLMNSAAIRILEKDRRLESVEGSELKNLFVTDGRTETEVRVASGPKILGHHLTRLPGGGSLLVFQDLTQIRGMESRMALQEKMASVGRLAAGIAHEIRNPLASLSGSIQLLKVETPDNHPSERLMKIVLRETDRLDDLIRNFLDYAKPSQLQVEKVSVKSLIEDLVTLVKNSPEFHERNIQLDVQVTSDLEFRCDQRQLRQILWNLIRNAVQAIEKSGTIRVVATQKDSHVIIEIHDTGMGIPENDRERIFDPFYSTKSGGTGLGLALVYQMVKAHGGRVHLESKVGVGTCFRIEMKKDGPQPEQVAA